jgi:uncharacterized alpha-E superfamily protein
LAEENEKKPESARDIQDLLDELLTIFSAFSGLIWENTTRSHRWRFLEMGRRVERAYSLVTLLRRSLATKHPEPEAMVLELLLEVADGSRSYRRRYPSGLQTAPVLDLLLADPDNPRSVAFQLRLLEDYLEGLPPRGKPGPLEKDDLLLLKCQTSIQLADIHHLADPKKKGPLRNLLRELGRHLPALSDYLSRKYLTHLILSNQGQTFGREVLP